MLMGKSVEQRVPWFSGLLLVALLSFLGALLVVDALHGQRLGERKIQRQEKLEHTAAALAEQTTQGAVVGAVALMGLTEPLFKTVAQGLLPADAPAVLAALEAVRGRFGLDGVYVIAADGTIVAHALQGRVTVYAAVGSMSHERGLYVAAPLYAGSTPETAVLGVVLSKMSFAAIDSLLARSGTPMLLLSPQGVAFASTRPEWQYAVAPPLTQSRIDAIAGL